MDSLKDVLKPIRDDINSRIRVKEKWIREGFTVIPNVLLLDKRISPQAKVVFCILSVHAFTKGYAFPSYEILGEEIGLSKPQLIKYIKELEEAGVIEVTRTGRANRYEIIFSALEERHDWVVGNLAKVKERIAKRRKGEK